MSKTRSESWFPLYFSKYATAFEQKDHSTKHSTCCTTEHYLVHILLASPLGADISLVGKPMPTYSLINFIVLAFSLLTMFWDKYWYYLPMKKNVFLLGVVKYKFLSTEIYIDLCTILCICANVNYLLSFLRMWDVSTVQQYCDEHNKDTLVQALLYCNKVLENMFIFNCFISEIMPAQGKRELSMYFSGVQKHLFKIYAN